VLAELELNHVSRARTYGGSIARQHGLVLSDDSQDAVGNAAYFFHPRTTARVKPLVNGSLSGGLSAGMYGSALRKVMGKKKAPWDVTHRGLLLSHQGVRSLPKQQSEYAAV